MSDPKSSLIDPYYTSGRFLASSSGWRDAAFKAAELGSLLKAYAKRFDVNLLKAADVGCGTGDTTLLLADTLTSLGYSVQVDGYDVHPDIEKKEGKANVTFHRQDFCAVEFDEPYDLVVLFDVIEHVPDPISFLKSVASRSKLVGLHIPLDDSWFGWMRNLPHRNLSHPGHLVVLDTASSLNLLTFAGLRIQDFTITPVFRAPSGSATKSQKLLNPLRRLLYRISPYLVQKLLGGVSLMVIAQTPLGFETSK
ncbi:MAG: class I SAM-dependent methyltransferase [Anaerolineae bacterium]